MLTFFTDPYPDELIYSAIARYHYYIGNIDCKDTLEELFGKRTVIPNIYIGSNLNSVVKQLGNQYSVDRLINNHTIFPFYSPFLPITRKTEILKDIKYNDGGAIYTKIGIVAGGICKKEGIYYCVECAKNDLEKYGETYIHREHQLQGVLVCPHHSTYLHCYTLNNKNTSRLMFIKLDEKYFDDNEIGFKNTILIDKLCNIAKLAYRLITYNTNTIDKSMILKRYKNLLYERGLTSINENIKQRTLYEEFIAFYGEDLLALLESSVDNNNEYNWLRVITRDLKRTVHPIRHILLINFLVGDIDEFFTSINKKYKPFGINPWPCLNKISEHYRRSVVTDLKISEDSKNRLPVGTFTCNCGFSYSRKGPDNCSEDRYRIGIVKSFGHEWEDKLKKTLEKGGLSIREVSRIMKCDSKTVVKYDEILGLNYFENSVMKIQINKEVSSNSDINKMNSYKNTILKRINEYPAANSSEIRNLCKKEYMYIYRRNKKWLMDSLPKKQKIYANLSMVDWNNRDKEVLNLLQGKRIEFLKTDKPKRVTKSSLGKALGILPNLEKNIEKLPKSKEYLDEVVETVENFQMRRCKSIINLKMKDNGNVKLWQVQRIAGIRTRSFKKMQNQLKEYINLKGETFKYEQ